jgi:cell wall assembly regulator SMI1
MKLPIEEFQTWLKAISDLGGDARELVIKAGASEEEIRKEEEKIGIPLPTELREALKLSSHFEFCWFLPDDFSSPTDFREIFCGQLHWGLEFIENFYSGYQGWIRECFPNPDDSYDAVWHHKFPFHEVGNGDYLAFDLNDENYGKIIYLSHDDGEGHGYEMASSFSELLANWVSLGCVGAEDWQWLPFTNGMKSRIDPNSENGKQWRSLILKTKGSDRDRTPHH